MKSPDHSILPEAASAALDELGRFGIHLGLDHVGRLLGALGDPHLARPTVLVAGTNGKGSTAATLAAMATAAGHRTGLYTSPHLEHVTERVRVDGRPVDGGLLGDAILEVLAAAEDLRRSGALDAPPTYFEGLTAAAALVFRDAAVDLAILEVGLGGRLDATNTTDPVLSVITPVALDHGDLLGDTLTAVAREKAGILRPGRPAVAWGADPEVRTALAAAAAERGADLTFADDDVEIRSVAPLPPIPWGGLRVQLTTPRGDYDLESPLPGRHQADNLALAVRAAERLSEAPGFTALPPSAITAGAATVHWPGRLETVQVDDRRFILDGAHNPAAAEALAEILDEAADAGGARPVLVFGVLTDKDAPAMLPPLASRAAHLILTRPPGDRGRDPSDLLPLLPPDSPPRQVIPDPAAALITALTRSPDAPVLVCGSLLLVGAARSWLRRHYGLPAV